jgi:hypothetical protein
VCSGVDSTKYRYKSRKPRESKVEKCDGKGFAVSGRKKNGMGFESWEGSLKDPGKEARSKECMAAKWAQRSDLNSKGWGEAERV